MNKMEIKLTIAELVEFARRCFDSGKLAAQQLSHPENIDQVKESMIVAILSDIQDTGEFSIPPEVGNPFGELSPVEKRRS